MNPRRFDIGIVALACAAGCAPTHILQRPADWPQEWNRRALYHTPNGCIYASSPSSAGEIDRIARDAVQMFSHDTGGTATLGLIIVNDIKDPLICRDLRTYAGLLEHAGATSQSAASQPNESWEKQQHEFEELGVPIDIMLAGTSAPILRKDLTAPLGFPTEVESAAAWAAVIPTKRLCRDMIRRVTNAAMKKEEITFAQRLLIAPLMPIIESMAVDEMAEARKTIIFERLVLSQPDWSPEKKRQCLEALEVKLKGEQAARLSARERDVRVHAAIQNEPPKAPASQSTSAPASQATR